MPLVKFSWTMHRDRRTVPPIVVTFTPLPLNEMLSDSSAAPDEPVASLNPSLLFLVRTEFETCAPLFADSISMPFELLLMNEFSTVRSVVPPPVEFARIPAPPLFRIWQLSTNTLTWFAELVVWMPWPL